eukprot:15272074-Alexandrium_andersonii.AAC.2
MAIARLGTSAEYVAEYGLDKRDRSAVWRLAQDKTAWNKLVKRYTENNSSFVDVTHLPVFQDWYREHIKNLAEDPLFQAESIAVRESNPRYLMTEDEVHDHYNQHSWTLDP